MLSIASLRLAGFEELDLEISSRSVEAPKATAVEGCQAFGCGIIIGACVS
jgi:hypothetical protein